MMQFCCDALRREATRASALNGIDFIEVIDNAAVLEADRQRFVHVHLLKDPAPVVYGPDQITVTGPSGALEVVDAVTGLGPQTNVIVVELAAPGDFDTHGLAIRRGLLDDRPPVELDPRLTRIDFSFKVECPSDFDCAGTCDCPDDPQPLPDISYLARDIDSFRAAMLDRIGTLQPGGPAPHAVDQGMAIIDALAVLADGVAYRQDASHTEAWISRLRHRISARRLGRLVDYTMDEGRNARCFVHLEASGDAAPAGPGFAPVLPAGTAFTTRLAGMATRLPADPAILAAAPVVYEAMTPLPALFALHNRLPFYTWSDQRCCLPAGAIAATLSGHFPDLAAGMFLAFEEVVGPRTGAEADRDRTNRPVVRLTLAAAFASPGVPLTDRVTGAQITEIAWDPADALTRPLCLSAETDEEFGRLFVPEASVARGNVVLADHGRTVADEDLGAAPASRRAWAPGLGPAAMAAAGAGPCADEMCAPARPERITPRYRPRLEERPLTFAPPFAPGDGARALLAAPGDPAPALALIGTLNGVPEPYAARRDLLGGGPDARDVAPEIDDEGRAILRFGDDVNGRRPNEGEAFAATYRVGLGPDGNVGEDRLIHVRSDVAEIAAVRNMTPGTGGRRPETIEEMRRRAPFAFRRQDRAVTRADHDEVAARFAPPEGPLQGTVTDIMHVGSWRTVFVTADRRGGLPVTPEFERDLRAHLERFRMAGRDLEVEGPIDVPIEIDMEVCARPDVLRSQVKAAVAARFSNRILPDGEPGAFHPDRMTFGATLHLSPLIALAQSVEGVAAVRVLRFRRFSDPGSSGLSARRLTFGRREIARLDNDPSRPANGVLRLTMKGGR